VGCYNQHVVVLEYRILGPVEVAAETGPLPLGGQKQRALLALLLLNAGSVVSTDRIIDELWGELPPKTASSSLQNLVSRLRRLLGAEAVVMKPPGYVLVATREQIDASRFERLVVEARRAEAGERALKLRDALALWRGPALADCAFEAFAQADIRRLEELRLDALEERVEADLELGSGAELVGEIESLVASHPLRERLRGQLMVALYRAGRQAEALQVYHDARRALVDELGIEPGALLQRLYRLILRQDTALERAPPRAGGDHFGDVVKALLGGQLVLVVGAGANRQAQSDTHGVPSPAEIGAYLASVFACPEDYARNLANVAEYVTLAHGVGPLYDELHRLLATDHQPGPVQLGLAGLAALLRQEARPQPLIVTTSFDRTLEQAFEEAGEEFDVVCYLALGRHRGRFLHLTAEGDATVIELPNAYADLSLEQRPVILKALGGIDRRPDREWDSFVVSEDDHIDYLAQTGINVVLPVTVAAKLRRSHFLFLGYPVDEWSLRVFLHRVWGRETVAYRSWAVGPQSSPIEREHWRRRGIDVVDVPLDEYLAELGTRVGVEAPA
jgi:DNA-binding SARP family transcriptional activator